MVRTTLLLTMFINVIAHAHWNQPPEPSIEPIICPGHPGTFATIHPEHKSVTITLYQNNKVVRTIRKDYQPYKFQFSAGCARLMMESENGRESISLFGDA